MDRHPLGARSERGIPRSIIAIACAPTQDTAPTGGVEGATGTPAITLPPTDTIGQPTAGSVGLWAALLLLVGVVTTVTVATFPVISAQGRRQR